MANSVYKINKGINKPIEFKGLKAQYIWYLGGGLGNPSYPVCRALYHWSKHVHLRWTDCHFGWDAVYMGIWNQQ